MQYHPVVSRIEAELKKHRIPFKRFEHEPVRTSEEANAVRPEYTLAQGAKALIVRFKREGEKSFAMIVVPGDARFLPKKARAVLGAKDLRFASPEEVHELTGGIEPGGVPPFGNLFGLPVYADKRVFENGEIIFNAGDRRVSIAMPIDGFADVVSPIRSDLC